MEGYWWHRILMCGVNDGSNGGRGGLLMVLSGGIGDIVNWR